MTTRTAPTKPPPESPPAFCHHCFCTDPRLVEVVCRLRSGTAGAYCIVCGRTRVREQEKVEVPRLEPKTAGGP